jgi:hypothetical protein
MDNPRDHQIDAAPPNMPGELRLLAVMEQSERELASGMTVPLASVLAELDGTASQVEARFRVRRA